MTKHKSLTTDHYNKLFVLVVWTCLTTIMMAGINQGYQQFEANFFRRDWLIQNFNRLKYLMGNQVFLPNVVIGKNQWLLYAGDKNLDDYQNAIPLSERQMTRIENNVKTANNFGAKHNVQFLVVVAPNKETIYPDIAPDTLPVMGSNSRHDQLYGKLGQYSNIRFLDLRDALINGRQNQDTYYKTDTHWNNFGAYIAYSEIVRKLFPDHPQLRIFPRNKLIVTNDVTNFDLARSMGAWELAEHIQRLTPPDDSYERITFSEKFGYHEMTKNQSLTTPSLIMYHDSFGGAGLNSYIPLSFQTVHLVRYEEDHYFPPNIIQNLSPDIVIIEIVERHIHMLGEILSLAISN